MTRKLKVFRCEVQATSVVSYGDTWTNAADETLVCAGGVLFLLARSISEATSFAGPKLKSVKEIGVGYVTDDLTQRMMREEEVRDDVG